MIGFLLAKGIKRLFGVDSNTGVSDKEDDGLELGGKGGHTL